MRNRINFRAVIAAFVVAPAMAAGGWGLALAGAAAPGRQAGTPPAAPSRCPPPPPSRGGGGLGAGPNDAPIVDAAAADRGRRTYAAQCINCHGSQARGTSQGVNLVRSLVVLHDRCGSALEPFLDKGHPTQSGEPSATLTSDQVTDLAHFLRQRVNDMMRGSPMFDVKDILTGDPKAGSAFFAGPGRCATCHSVTGDLAGIGSRLSPVNIQQRFLFPSGGGRGRGRGRGAAPPLPTAVTVTVTPAGGAAVSGVLVQLDDFVVSLRDAHGDLRTFRRTPSLKVEKTVPLAAHIALLDTITDQQIHDVVAYLETLK
jgi:mono/diheme cytochrome c family protein